MKIKANNLMIGDLMEVAVGDGEWKCVRVEELYYNDYPSTIIYKDIDNGRAGFFL